jgi:hypothetical protein
MDLAALAGMDSANCSLGEGLVGRLVAVGRAQGWRRSALAAGSWGERLDPAGVSIVFVGERRKGDGGWREAVGMDAMRS